MVRSLVAPAVLVSAFALVGCGAPAERPPPAFGESRPARGVVAPIPDERFADAVRQLLMAEPHTEARRVLLAQTVSRQMVRASSFFDASASDRGLAAVQGGFALTSVGELEVGMFGPNGKTALAGAARELAGRGDEGGAFAAYGVLAQLSPEAERKEHEAHLAAIARWLKDLATASGAVDGLQMVKNAAVARVTLEPSDVAIKEATARTTEWLERGIEFRANFRRNAVPRGFNPRSAESHAALEAVAALKLAPVTLAAIYLRQGDAKGALAAVEKSRAGEVAPQLVQVLEPVAKQPTAERWIELLHALRPEEGDEVDATLNALLRVAQLRVACEAYRLDPTILDSAGEVAVGLMDLEMFEAAPAIIAPAIKAHPEPRVVAQGLGLIMQAMMRAPDADSARRAYKAGAPVVAIADGLTGKLQPSPSQVRALMGELALRDGQVGEARALLEAAAKVERTGAVSATLARIARSEGRVDEALSHIKDSLGSPDVERSPSLRGEILLMQSDLMRERGQMDAARSALETALRGLAAARKADDSEARARVERTLAKVLDRFGARDKAKQALERAFDAAPRDKQEASATIMSMASRALVQSDVGAVRDGLRRGLAADLPPDDLVYLALWVRIVERTKKSSSDPLVERTFGTLKDDGRWTGRLAAFGLGRLGAKELLASAKTPAQKTEALFYGAMEQRIAGDGKGADASLDGVVRSSGGIELIEVGVARDLLSGPRGNVAGPVPDVGLP